MPAARRKTVLVVEDQEDNRCIACTYLENSGYRVLQASNGAEGVSAACAERPDIILMDIKMPVMDGIEAVRQLKRYPALRDVPIVAYSAHAQRDDIEAGLAAGFDGYVTKPAELSDLLAEVARLIGPATSDTLAR